MANYILEKIKVEGQLVDIIGKSNGENVKVTYNETETTLAAALADIVTKVGAAPTTESMNTAISSAIDGLINGAPATYDTLKEIADYIAAHEEVSTALSQAIGNKVDKVEGKGLSSEDFTAALKTKLENMESVTAEEKAAWSAKAEKAVATKTADGLMSAADKARLDGIRGVRYGTEIPVDLQDGELFVRVAQ